MPSSFLSQHAHCVTHDIILLHMSPILPETKPTRRTNLLWFKSNARETWCVILISASWHLLFRITALYTSFRSAQNHCLPDNVRPRGAFISVGDWTPTEKYLLLLTTCRSRSLNSDWDKKIFLNKKAVYNRQSLSVLHDFFMSIPLRIAIPDVTLTANSSQAPSRHTRGPT